MVGNTWCNALSLEPFDNEFQYFNVIFLVAIGLLFKMKYSVAEWTKM